MKAALFSYELQNYSSPQKRTTKPWLLDISHHYVCIYRRRTIYLHKFTKMIEHHFSFNYKNYSSLQNWTIKTKVLYKTELQNCSYPIEGNCSVKI